MLGPRDADQTVLGARVHERYLYPALAVLTLIAVDAPATLVLYSVLTATLFTNLIWVKRFREGFAALNSTSAGAITIGLLNVVAFAIAALYCWLAATPDEALSDKWPHALRWFFGKWELGAAQPPPAAIAAKPRQATRRR